MREIIAGLKEPDTATYLALFLVSICSFINRGKVKLIQETTVLANMLRKSIVEKAGLYMDKNRPGAGEEPANETQFITLAPKLSNLFITELFPSYVLELKK